MKITKWKKPSQINLGLFSLLCLFVCASQLSPRAAALTDVSPTQFAMLYFDTPVLNMRSIEGEAYQSSQAGLMGYLTFECDSKPVLRNQFGYKPGGDFTDLVDTFLVMFGEKAWPLLHAKDTECLRFVEPGPIGLHRWFLYNRNTHRYFFRRGGHEMYPK